MQFSNQSFFTLVGNIHVLVCNINGNELLITKIYSRGEVRKYAR